MDLMTVLVGGLSTSNYAARIHRYSIRFARPLCFYLWLLNIPRMPVCFYLSLAKEVNEFLKYCEEVNRNQSFWVCVSRSLYRKSHSAPKETGEHIH